jgi:phage terminase large subunit-like protein
MIHWLDISPDALLEEVSRPESVGLVVAVRYVDAREAALPTVLRVIERMGLKPTLSVSRMELWFDNGARVLFRWESDGDALRGLRPDWLWSPGGIPDDALPLMHTTDRIYRGGL